MKIYDITQELFSSKVYEGDPKPQFQRFSSIEQGDDYNITAISMCVHNGTHIDAPNHICKDGKTVDEIDLHKCLGLCSVRCSENRIEKEQMISWLLDKKERLLIKGNGSISLDAVQAAVDFGVTLLGMERQTVGDENIKDEISLCHKVLLEREIVILEGLLLDKVPEGDYLLCALPLKLGGIDGSPCRAILIANEEDDFLLAKGRIKKL